MGRCENSEPKQGLTISIADSHVAAIASYTKKRSKFIRFAIERLLIEIEEKGWDKVKDYVR